MNRLKLAVVTALVALAASCTGPSDEGTVSFESNGKLTICHNGHTISIASAAWHAHAAHGDTMGACNASCGTGALASLQLRVRSDLGVTLDAGGGVETLQDLSGHGHAATAPPGTGPRLVADSFGRTVLRFGNSTMTAPLHVPAQGTLFIVYGGQDGHDAFGRPIGWGDSYVGSHGIDLLTLPGFGTDAVFRENALSGDIVLATPATFMEVDALSWGPAGVTYDRRLADGSWVSAANTGLLTVSDGGFLLHIGNSGDGGDPFYGDLAELAVLSRQLGECARHSVVDDLFARWSRPLPPAPTITSVSPSSGRAGDHVTLTGTGFTGVSAVRFIGGGDLGFTVASSTQIDTTVPGGLPSGAFTVTTLGGTASSPPFTILPPVVSGDAVISFPAGLEPRGVAVGDFNGDGHNDVVTANFGGGDASVVIINADGTAQAPVHYPTGEQPSAVAVADFNHDGHLDVAVANINHAFEDFSRIGTVSILLGNGNGTLQPAVNYTGGVGPNSVAIADLDGDGNLDLAVTNYASHDVSVFFGTGSGGFAAPASYPAPSNPRSVAIADIDGDGTLDLAVALSNQAKICVLHGIGGGVFQLHSFYDVAGDAYSIAAADLDGDGHADLVAAALPTTNISVLRGNGDLSFQPAASYVAGDNPIAVAIGDLNSDGRPDVAVANLSGDASVLFGNGDGTFQSAIHHTVGGGPFAVAIGDMNADGKLDFVTANIGSANISIVFSP